MHRLVSLQEIQKHNKVDDAWIVIDGKVTSLQFSDISFCRYTDELQTQAFSFLQCDS